MYGATVPFSANSENMYHHAEMKAKARRQNIRRIFFSTFVRVRETGVIHQQALSIGTRVHLALTYVALTYPDFKWLCVRLVLARPRIYVCVFVCISF